MLCIICFAVERFSSLLVFWLFRHLLFENNRVFFSLLNTFYNNNYDRLSNFYIYRIQ